MIKSELLSYNIPNVLEFILAPLKPKFKGVESISDLFKAGAGDEIDTSKQGTIEH